MGAWGPALWSDDFTADVRGDYRRALEDGLTDEAAAEKLLAGAPARDDDEYVAFWMALAVAQHNLGRLTDQVRDTAVGAIDSGDDLPRWQDTDARMLAKRVAVLAKVRAQLLAPQPQRKRVRPPARNETDLEPGDVLAYQTESGRSHLLVVRAVTDSREGRFPVVQLLDYHAVGIPGPKRLARLRDQPRGRMGRGDQSNEPWSWTGGVVLHKRGHNYGDVGFTVVGRLTPLSDADQQALTDHPYDYSRWEPWRDYLESEDAHLQPATGGPIRRWMVRVRGGRP